MQLTIKQSRLLEMLQKGGIASLIDEGKVENDNLDLIISCSKISVEIDGNMTVESTCPLFAVKVELEATAKNDIAVKESGSVLVPTKEIIQWVKAQGSEAMVTMTFKAFDRPKYIDPSEDLDPQTKGKLTLKHSGSLKMLAKDSAKSGAKWTLDSLDVSHFPTLSFDHLGNKHFDIRVDNLERIVKRARFAAMDYDSKHILDNLSIQTWEDDLYIVATDTKRCCAAKMELLSDVQNSEESMLAPHKLLNEVIKVSPKKNTVSIYYNKDKGRIYFLQPEMTISIASGEDKFVNAFPKISALTATQYNLVAEVSKEALAKSVMTVAMVDKDCSLFWFKEDVGALIMKAISKEGKYRPTVTKVDALSISQEAKFVLDGGRMSPALKMMVSESVKIWRSSDGKLVKVTGEDDPGFSYFCVSIRNKRYMQELSD